MTTKEQRELDAWIAENVMGYRRTDRPDDHTTDAATLFWHRPAGDTREAVLVGCAYSHSTLTKEYGKEMFSHSWTFYQPTTDPAAAFDVLKRCVKKADHLEFDQFPNGDFRVFDWNHSERAETLELAVAKFAKQLFTKL